jgi:hypothetical protein
MPLPLSQEILAADLREYKRLYQDRPENEQPPNSTYYGPDRAVNVVDSKGNVPPIAVLSMDLSQWTIDEPSPTEDPGFKRDRRVAIDANLGRLAILNTQSPAAEIRVNYCYGLSDEIGGGPYRRSVQLSESEQSGFQQAVAKGTTTHTLKQALDQWEEYCRQNSSPCGVIRILDNGVYGGNVSVRLPRGAQLAIIADNGARPTIRPIGNLNVICGEVEPAQAAPGQTVVGSPPPGPEQAVNGSGAVSAREFLLNGPLVYGGIHVSEEGQPLATEKLTVTIGHCTLMPNGIQARLSSKSNAQGLQIAIDHSIVGPLRLPATSGNLTVTDSIIDSAVRGARYAVAADNGGAPGPAVHLERVTVFGQVSAKQVTACNVIFTEPVTAPQPKTQDDEVRFSYVPADSVTPNHEPYLPISKALRPPVFTSKHFGDPAYAQLSERCPLDIRGGASHGSEIGAFHELHTPQAEANIPSVLDEYLPAGLQARVFYVT